jgi:hypothetical protein
MKSLALRLSVSVLSLASIVSLSGCSGFEGTAFPPTSTNPEQVSIGPISGSVFGGHAPLVGSHVYLLQASTSGYGAPATSLLTSLSTGTSSTYPVTVNTSDPIIPANSSYYYETTDSTGAFNLSGDYTCTTGPGNTDGPPVYVYAYGGSPSYPSTSNVFGSNQIVVSDLVGRRAAETATYTFTISSNAPELFYVGENVTFSNFTGTIAAAVNNQSGTVLATNLTTTTFAVSLPDANGTYTAKTYATTGTVTASPTFNPGVVNIAVLGNCPSTKNFAGSISYVYMNEVSTVAAAYALSGFTSSTLASINFLNIGSSSTNLAGLRNAALNANQLYDIQGSDISKSLQGEGHIARSATPVGNGTVAQSTLDTLGNILASCVDSQNTYNSVSNTGTASVQCTTLFANATADGTTAGAKPIDTATAALNLAHNPYSTAANYVSNIYALGSAGNVPFTPRLTATPNDFTVSIAYTGGGMGPSIGGAPHSVAVDGSGNIWAATANNTLAEFSPLGVPAVANGYSGNGLNQPTSATLDAASNNVWVGNYGNAGNAKTLSRFTTGGQATGLFTPGGSGIQDVAFDGAGNAWVSASSNQLDELSSTGTILLQVGNNGLNFADALSLEPGLAGNIWMSSANTANLSGFTHTGTKVAGSPFANGVPAGYGDAIDSQGNIWVSGLNGRVGELSTTGVAATNSPFVTNAPAGNGTTPGLDGIAIDGSGSVWIASPSGGSIYQLSSTGVNLSSANGYGPTNSTYQPDGLALDGSGNVWFNSLNNSILYELVGASVPVVTPIAAGVANNTLGAKP